MTGLPVDESTRVIARAARKKAKNTTSTSGRTESRKGTDSGTDPRKSKLNEKLKFTMTTQELSATEVPTAALAENPIEVPASATIAVEIQVPTAAQALAPTSDISKLLAAMAEPGADLTSLMQQIAAVRNVDLVVATNATPAGSDAGRDIDNETSKENKASCSRTPVREEKDLPTRTISPTSSELTKTQATATATAGQPIFLSAETQKRMKSFAPIVEKERPIGLPPADELHNYDDMDKLFAYWNTANQDKLAIECAKNKIRVQARPLKTVIPNSMSASWQRTVMAQQKAKRELDRLEREDVKSFRHLQKYWDQPGQPLDDVPALMVYDVGDLEVPQWPRLTSSTILSVFPNLADTTVQFVQDMIATHIAKDGRFKNLLDESWALFHEHRDASSLPAVNHQDEYSEMKTRKFRLEEDVWVPNAPSFTPAQTKVNEFKGKKADVTKTYKQVAAAISARTPAPTRVAPALPPALPPVYAPNPDFREPQRRRVAVTTAIDAIWAMTRITGILPTPENEALANHADAMATQNATQATYAPGTGAINKDATVTELTDGRHAFEIPSDNDLDSTRSGTSDSESSDNDGNDNSDNSDDSDDNNDKDNSDNSEDSDDSDNSEDSDSGESTDPDFDPDYDLAKEKHSRDTSKKGGKDKTKRSSKSNKPKKSNDKVNKAKRRKSELKTKRKADKTKKAIVTAEAYLAQANIVDPKCPLPYLIDNKVAAADYLMWGMPKVCGFAYKSILANHKEYVEKGDISWDNWSFAVRDTCRNLGWSHDQSWRVATRLLPDKLQGHVYDVVQSKGFQGLCWNTWSLLVCKHTDQMNAITVAKHALATLAFEDNEQVPEFLSRFLRIARKATTSSNGIEDPLKPLAVLTHLNRIITNPGKRGPTWLVGSWRQQFTTIFSALRTKNTMGLNDKGVRYSTAECDSHVTETISYLVDYLRNLHETRQTTTNDINVLFANSHYDINDQSNQPAPANDSHQKSKNFNKRKFNHQPSGITNNIAATATHSATHKKGVSCRGSKPRTWSRRPRGSGGEQPEGEDLNPTAMLVGKELKPIPDWRPEWDKLKPLPDSVRLSCHAQAAVEFGVVPLEKAVERYKAQLCAACGRTRDQCSRQFECIGLPKDKLLDCMRRSQYLYIADQHRRAANK